MRVWIKVCGITREIDALGCAKLGVDALGFNFYLGSPRYVSEVRAREIISLLPASIEKIGVFVNHSREEISHLVVELGLTGIQFHGDEPDSLVNGWEGVKTIRALRPKNEAELRQFLASTHTDAVLLDAYHPASYGGTGEQVPQHLVTSAMASSGKRIILSGGLRPDNIAELLAAHRPFAVDVASGVESEPGVKSVEKVGEFVTVIRNSCR